MSATPHPTPRGCLGKLLVGCAAGAGLATFIFLAMIALYTLSAPGVRPDAHLYNDIGRWLYDQRGGYYMTRAMYDLAVSTQPTYAQAYYNRAVLSHSRGGPKAALGDYTQAIQLRPNDAQAYVMRGSAHYDLGDRPTAILDYDRAIEIRPDFAFAYLNRGIVYRELGENEKAVSDLKQVLALNAWPDQRELAEKHLAELQHGR